MVLTKTERKSVIITTQRDRDNDIDAVGKCDDCGENVTLQTLVNTCGCGANYNLFGQRQIDNPDYWSNASDY